jgi:hypothetical protein
MDPVAVIKTMWRFKSLVFPVLLITMIAAVYVFQFGPRYFESSASYALVNPRIPTDKELAANPDLEKVTKTNPFLRSPDPGLITEVVIARLNASAVPETLNAEGLNPDYTVSKGINGNGFMVTITGNGDSEQQALATTRALGGMLQAELSSVQKVNGADDGSLFTALSITPLDKATEQFSSRLRSVVMVLIGGIVMIFGAVSAARSLEAMRSRRRITVKAKRPRGRRASAIVAEDTHPEPSSQDTVPVAANSLRAALDSPEHADKQAPERLLAKG